MLDEYFPAPIKWSERVIATYLKWEWLYGIALLPMVYLLLTGKLNVETIYSFMFSKASAPGVDSMAPFMGLLIGAVTGWAVALLAALRVIQRHRYSPRYNPGFRRQLWQYAGNLFMTLNLVGAFAGLMIGHYLV